MFDASLGSFRVTLVCASCGLLVLLVLVGVGRCGLLLVLLSVLV